MHIVRDMAFGAWLHNYLQIYVMDHTRLNKQTTANGNAQYVD